jgi:dihydrofolate reductase
MRKIILFMHMSLDGFIASTDGDMNWATLNDDDMGKYLITDLLNTVDSVLIGRKLYQGFENYWPAAAADPATPKELADFAHWIEDSPKYVFSKTLETAGWKNSIIIKGDITEEIKKLKQLPGGDMVIFGGAGMSAVLVQLGLIDEYRFKLEPVILGKGRPLFKDVEVRRNLKLIKSKKFQSGVVGLYYKTVK